MEAVGRAAGLPAVSKSSCRDGGKAVVVPEKGLVYRRRGSHIYTPKDRARKNTKLLELITVKQIRKRSRKFLPGLS
jgi:hypothetical protein